MSGERTKGQPYEQLRQLAKVMQKEEEENRSNPVTQSVKMIMVSILGYLLIFLASDNDISTGHFDTSRKCS